ncbi:MAG: SH3 domain-containing protein [Lachnospiraceae bacterium]|nr:SH3 domain-containing protein [Lachnospiraceae bacterium]
MERKKAIVTGIGIVVVIAGILGSVMLHKDGEAVETMAETTEQTAETAPPTAEEDSTALPEEAPKEAEAQPQTAENTDTEETLADTADTEQETEVSQEDEGKQDEAEQDMAEPTKDEEMEEIDAYLYTTADLNMRKEGATDSEVIGSIPYGTQIHVTARTADNWYRTERGEIGFVSGKYLSDTKPEQTVQASSGDTTTSQPSGDSSQSSGGTQSSVPGISQAQMDKINSVVNQMNPNQGAYSDNMEMAWEGGGGRSINR